jgi:hypothetical protein
LEVGGLGGVRLVLRRRHAHCLERSLILQRWFADHGRPMDVVIGVSSPRDFTAHAWLDGDEPQSAVVYAELLRRPPPTGRSDLFVPVEPPR